jgi:endonuclease YncB( thermonuclease family)
MTSVPVRLLGSAAAFVLLINSAVAEELRSVDPKTVIDGDTFYVSIRVFGIDAPEQGDRAKCDQERDWAKHAKDRVKELLHGRVTLDLRGIDDFGRLLATVRLQDGRDLGQVLLRENLARPYKPGHRPNWCE